MPLRCRLNGIFGAILTLWFFLQAQVLPPKVQKIRLWHFTRFYFWHREALPRHETVDRRETCPTGFWLGEQAVLGRYLLLGSALRFSAAGLQCIESRLETLMHLARLKANDAC